MKRASYLETVNKETKERRYYIDGRRVSVWQYIVQGGTLECFSTTQTDRLWRHRHEVVFDE
jgi:hypothetical protein